MKPLILALMMFFSLKSLGVVNDSAVLLSLVPLLLGLLNVLTAFAYGLTGLIFILACATTLDSEWQGKSENIVNKVIQPIPKNLYDLTAIKRERDSNNNEKQRD
jgi:hypothetical protein